MSWSSSGRLVTPVAWDGWGNNWGHVFVCGTARACIQYLRPFVQPLFVEDSALMSSLCFETLFFNTQFIQVIICCRGVCRGSGNRSGLEMGCQLRELRRSLFGNGEIFYFTIFLSPAFSGLLGDSGTKEEGEERRGLQNLVSTSDKCISFNPTTDFLRLSSARSPSSPRSAPSFLSRVINSMEHLES